MVKKRKKSKLPVNLDHTGIYRDVDGEPISGRGHMHSCWDKIMGTWYYQTDGNEIGPVSDEDLEAVAASGVIGPEALVCRTSDQVWQRAGCLPSLQFSPSPSTGSQEPPHLHSPTPDRFTPPPLPGVESTGEQVPHSSPAAPTDQAESGNWRLRRQASCQKWCDRGRPVLVAAWAEIKAIAITTCGHARHLSVLGSLTLPRRYRLWQLRRQAADASAVNREVGELDQKMQQARTDCQRGPHGSNPEEWTRIGLGYCALMLVAVIGLLGPSSGCNRSSSSQPASAEMASDSPRAASDQVAPTGGINPAPPSAVAPFDAAAAQGHQQAWAGHLGVPVKVTNSIGMKLVLIPAGEFMMGSPREEIDGLIREFSFLKDILEAEQPQHRVRITKPYYLGMYEVTQAEYERVMGTNPSAFSRSGSSGAKVSGQDTSRFPVERVSWEEAVEFCRKLSALPEERAAGRVYRLPTEAEWEFACRAGTTTPFHFGSQLNGREANCEGNYPYGTTTKGPYLERPTTVGSFASNGFGLFDMHGNVWEWCSDWYDSGYYANSPTDDPTGATAGSYRVYRGGSWDDYARHSRSADRSGVAPAYRGGDVGFRLAFSSVDQSGQ